MCKGKTRKLACRILLLSSAVIFHNSKGLLAFRTLWTLCEFHELGNIPSYVCILLFSQTTGAGELVAFCNGDFFFKTSTCLQMSLLFSQTTGAGELVAFRNGT